MPRWLRARCLLTCMLAITLMSLLQRRLINERTGFSQFKPVARQSEAEPRPPGSDYAYVYVIWRCNPDNLQEQYYSCRNYIASILVSVKLLRQFGSKADFVAYFKMDYAYKSGNLPRLVEELLLKFSIRVRYLPKSDDRGTNVAGTTFNKFVIFNMTDYRRVMHLDTDILPYNNLDYLFQLSDTAKRGLWLQENVMIAGILEPANTGIMLVSPNKTVYNDIQKLVEKKGKDLGRGRLCNATNPWGSAISHPNKIETNWPVGNNNNNNYTTAVPWNFHNACADQGWFYYYCMFVSQKCTHVLARKIVNYAPNRNGSWPIVAQQYNAESKESHPLWRYSTNSSIQPETCTKFTAWHCVPPWAHFEHFTSDRKPWLVKNPANGSSAWLWWKTFQSLQIDSGTDLSWFLLD